MDGWFGWGRSPQLTGKGTGAQIGKRKKIVPGRGGGRSPIERFESSTKIEVSGKNRASLTEETPLGAARFRREGKRDRVEANLYCKSHL